MKTALCALLAFVAAYLFTAFCLWELDPAQWSVIARLFGGWGVAIMFGIEMIYFEIRADRCASCTSQRFDPHAR